jgi:hypothetical protein
LANPSYSADALWGGRYHRPDKLLDPRGFDVTGQVIPPTTPLTRILPQVGMWSSISRLSAAATVSSP